MNPRSIGQLHRRSVLTAGVASAFLAVACAKEISAVALSNFGFIVTGAGLDPAKHRMEMKSDAFRMIAVGISAASQGPAVARELVSEGIQLLELCGGFGPKWTAEVIAAIDGRIPVGSVGYGPESIEGMYRLFAD